MAPTGGNLKPFSLDEDLDSSKEGMPPLPVMRLTSQLCDSSVNDSLSGVDSSSLMIEEVDMADCD